MKNIQNKIYLIELLLVIILSTCTLFNLTDNKYFTAILLTGIAVGLSLLLKREKIYQSNRNKVFIIATIFGILYVGLFYMLGLYTGFYRSTFFGMKAFLRDVIPIVIILISTEFIRSKLLLDQSLKSKVLVVIITSIIDVSIYKNLYSANILESFLALLGFISFAAIANNMLYTYLSSRYGKKPVIVYKLITVLYVYFFPVIPNVYTYFRAFARMIYPLLIYSYVEKYYNLDKELERPKDIRSQVISLSVCSVIIVTIIALISCKFLFGVLVIGSGSMSGSIEKGDLVLFKNVKDGIQVGDVIVFERDDLRIVHRVKAIKNINDQVRIYTQGDANRFPDDGYVTNDVLKGKVLLRIRYIGRPTLWLRSMFK